MIRLVVTIVGVLLLVAPLKYLFALTTVAAYRTGGFKDVALPVFASAALYGGVLAGVFLPWRFAARRAGAMNGLAVFIAGWAGAMAGVALALGVWALREWLTTGAVLRPGESAALLPIFPIIGGILALPIAAGAALVAAGLRRPSA
jgi:hypothetical protein